MRKTEGFILMEAMLAAAMLVGGIVVMYGTLSRSLKIAEISRDRFRAGLLLEGKVWEAEHGGKPPLGLETVDVSLPGVEWRTAGMDAGKQQISILWGEGGKRDELALTAVLPE